MNKLQLQIKTVVKTHGCISYGDLLKELNYTEDIREHVGLIRELCCLVDNNILIQEGGIYGNIKDPSIALH